MCDGVQNISQERQVRHVVPEKYSPIDTQKIELHVIITTTLRIVNLNFFETYNCQFNHYIIMHENETQG